MLPCLYVKNGFKNYGKCEVKCRNIQKKEIMSSVATGSGKSRNIEELCFHTPSAGMFGVFFSLLDIGRKGLAGRTEKLL